MRVSSAWGWLGWLLLAGGCNDGATPGGAGGEHEGGEDDRTGRVVREGRGGTSRSAPRPEGGAAGELDDTPEPQENCRNVELLADVGFELGGVWVESSSGNYEVVTESEQLALGGRWVAFLGGVASESSRIYQTVTVPETAVSLTASGWYSVYAVPEDDSDRMIGELRSAKNESLDVAFLDVSGLEGETAWLRFTRSFDDLEFLPFNRQIRYSISSENDGSESHSEFFVDDLSLVALVCE